MTFLGISWFTSPHLTLCVWSWLFPQVLTCTGHGTFLGDRGNNCDLKICTHCSELAEMVIEHEARLSNGKKVSVDSSTPKRLKMSWWCGQGERLSDLLGQNKTNRQIAASG